MASRLIASAMSRAPAYGVKLKSLASMFIPFCKPVRAVACRLEHDPGGPGPRLRIPYPLSAEVVEEHVVRTPHRRSGDNQSPAERTKGADELIGVLRTYLKRAPPCKPENLSASTHDHVFNYRQRARRRSTRVVMWITAAAMVM